MSTTAQLALRAFRPSDRAAVLGLLGEAMGGGPTGSRTEDFFDWKHRQSPFGASPAQVALDGERIVGVRLFLRWQLEREGRRLYALRAVDTATHPEYLRRGIFRELTLSLLTHLEESEQVDLVFNTPNADSRPGYLRMGWQEVGLLPVHIAPVRPYRFLQGMRSASRANASGNASAVSAPSPTHGREISCPLPPAAAAFDQPGELEDLISARPASSALRTPLSVEYLRWRYVDPPGLDYRCVPVHRGGRLVGIGFGRPRRRADLVEFTLGDVLVQNGDPRLVRSVQRAARRSGADHVAVHLSDYRDLRGQIGAALTGYLPVPSKGIRLVANPRRPGSSCALDPAHWELSLGDLEVF